MSIPVVNQINTGNQNQQFIQNNTANALVPVQKSPFIGGVQLNGVNLMAGSNAISHTLGRTPTIWVICDNTAAVTLYRTTWNTSTLNITSSGATTVSIWVN